MASGLLQVTVSVKVPVAAVHRVKALKSRTWVTQTVTIAKFEDVEATEAEDIVNQIRAKNKGADVRGQWTGSLNIGG